jgi:hypothetical protein
MLDHAATENNAACLRGCDCQVIELFIVLSDIENKTIALMNEMIYENISNFSIG